MAVSSFRLCLRQTIFLRIQLQVLLNTITFITYLIVLKIVLCQSKDIQKIYLILGNYCNTFEYLAPFYLCDTEQPITYFLNFVWRYLRDCDIAPVVSKCAHTVPNPRVRFLSTVYDYVAKTVTENQIGLAKSDLRFLLPETDLRHREKTDPEKLRMWHIHQNNLDRASV